MSIEPIYLTLVPGGIGALQCRMTNLQGLCIYNVKGSVCFFAFCTASPFSPFPLRGAIFKTKQALNHRHHKYLYPCTSGCSPGYWVQGATDGLWRFLVSPPPPPRLH